MRWQGVVASASFALTAALANIAEIDHRMMHRAGNLVLHLACGLLLAAFLELVFRSQPHSTAWRERSELLAAICSALWLVHPLQTEAVNYVVQRTEILVSLFYLGTLYAAIRARDATGKRGRRLWMTAAIIVGALGMATKEVMATVPIAVVLFDGAFRARHWSDLRPRVAFYVGLCLPWAIIAHGLITGGRGNTAGLEVHMSAASYLVYQAWAVAHYLRLVVWPAGLSIDYGVTPSGGARSLIGGLFLITALIAVLLAWKRRTRWGAIAFAGTTFFLLLAPSSSVIPIITELGAERRVYLASAAVIILIVVAIDHVWRAQWPQRRRLVGAFTLGVFLILVGLTARRNQAYASTTELWRTAVVNRPENTRAYVHYAKALIAETPPRYGEADSILRRAIAVDSMDAFAWDTRVWIAHLEQRYQDEYNLLETSLRIRPTHIWSLRCPWETSTLLTATPRRARHIWKKRRR